MTRIEKLIAISLLVLAGIVLAPWSFGGILPEAAPASAKERCEDCRYDVKIVRIYDGDTFFVEWPGLPDELNPLGVRIQGIDTPEIRGKCPAEKALAQAARDFTVSHLERSAGYVRVGDISWDKYGGRIDADVYVGSSQESLGRLLVEHGYARVYNGGKRQGWCY